MKISPLFLVSAGFALIATVASATNLTGKWTSEFDSQIGTQKYVYNLTQDGDKVTGKATYDHQMGKGENTLSDFKVDKDSVSFVELAHFNDQDVRITYTGKVSGNEMKLTRQVGDFGSEDIVAKRADATKKEATK